MHTSCTCIIGRHRSIPRPFPTAPQVKSSSLHPSQRPLPHYYKRSISFLSWFRLCRVEPSCPSILLRDACPPQIPLGPHIELLPNHSGPGPHRRVAGSPVLWTPFAAAPLRNRAAGRFSATPCSAFF